MALLIATDPIAGRARLYILGHGCTTTHCRLAYEWHLDREWRFISHCTLQTYPTMAYAKFEDALAELYLEPIVRERPPQAAALAVAGPVLNNCCRMTNLPWVIDGQELRKQHGILWAPLAPRPCPLECTSVYVADCF
jgi:glucokinase